MARGTEGYEAAWVRRDNRGLVREHKTGEETTFQIVCLLCSSKTKRGRLRSWKLIGSTTDRPSSLRGLNKHMRKLHPVRGPAGAAPNDTSVESEA